MIRSTGLAFGLAGLALTRSRTLECSPTFNGVPVSANFLMTQATKPFAKQFPSLEISAVFITGHSDFVYEEQGLFAPWYATGCTIKLPVYEKLSEHEERKIGNAGLKKMPCGSVLISGKYNCAVVEISEMRVFATDGRVVWDWQRHPNLV